MVRKFGILCHLRCKSGRPRIKAYPSCKMQPRAGLVHVAIFILSASGLTIMSPQVLATQMISQLLSCNSPSCHCQGRGRSSIGFSK